MQYRLVGNTGMRASIIGLGAEHLDRKPYAVVEETIHAALDCEINIIDVFMPGQEVRENIGKALSGKRDKVLLQGHIGSVDLNQQFDISRDPVVVRRYFENLLRFLKTEYIDFGMLFFIDSDDDYKNVFETAFIDYVVKLKEQGTIRAIGASSHNPLTAKRVVESGIVDMLMFSVNPAFDMIPISESVFTAIESSDPVLVGIEPTRAAFYSLCAQRGVGITAMKALGAGKLLSSEHTPFGMPMTVSQCIHYALTRPAVASVLIGAQSRREVQEAVAYLALSDNERDYSQIIAGYKDGFRGSCVYCNHCQPCPSAINIAAVTKYLDIAKLSPAGIPSSVTQHYAALSAHGSDCIACGICARRCPFGVDIVGNMQSASSLFGK